MSNVLTTSLPDGTQATLITQNQQTVDVTVLPEAGLGPTGPAGPTGPTGASGGALTNLSSVLWVDGATTVAPADQTGNVETPYDDVQGAIDAFFLAFPAAGSLFLYVVDSGAAYDPITIPDGKCVNLRGLMQTGSYPTIDGATNGANSNLVADSILFSSPVTSGVLAAGGIKLINCFGATVTADASTNVSIIATSSDQNLSGGGYGDVSGNDVSVWGASVQSVTAAGELWLQHSFPQGPTGASAGNTLHSDLISLANIDGAAVGISAPAVSVLDAPTVDVVVAVAGLAPAIEQISVAVADAKIGDTYALGVINRDGTNSLIGAPVCEVPGTVIIPVIAGGAGNIALRLSRLCVAAV